MAASRQTHPVWLMEGLATLYESAAITPDGLAPQLDTRLLSLQQALRAKKLIPLPIDAFRLTSGYSVKTRRTTPRGPAGSSTRRPK